MIVNIVEDFIDRVQDLNVAVVGETITDEFIYVSYEGQSMKSICPVLKVAGRHEVQAGGAAAIANHLKDFVKRVDLYSNHPNDIIKTRYVDVADQKKHVEINRFNISDKNEINIKVRDYDVVIVADFGHGFCNNINIDHGFHLMCQTNSNNFGFNRISKWKNYKKKSVCIDLREASLQMNRNAKFTSRDEVAELFNYEMEAEHLFITLGTQGSLYYDGNDICLQQSYKSDIVDTIGAGDTFFSFVALATQALGKNDNILVVPSLAASLSTTWLCNERSVTKSSLREYATRFI